jgi:uncharacterized membrane protein
MHHAYDPADRARAPVGLPEVRAVPATAPLRWLRDGFHDLRRMPVASGTAGAVVALIGVLLLGAAWRAPHMAPALLGGFLLVAPFLGLGLYAASRQLQRGEPLDPGRAWMSWRSNAASLALFGLILVLAYIFWERGAAILFALHYEGQPLQLRTLPMELLLSRQYDSLLFSYFGFGALIAALVFAISVVTAPLLLDHPADDVITAVLTSVRCCAANPAATALWALLIAALTALGFATAMVGLVVIFPWLAHASWHAYRDMVDS